MRLKGHQIIGELRLFQLSALENPLRLKGHQIIGELRPSLVFQPRFLSNWRVTRSLVSYDHVGFQIGVESYIEGSPDHWWVTTLLRQDNIEILYWRVTRSLVSYDSKKSWCSLSVNWRVTRSLVSYDQSLPLNQKPSILKGHQIIGELRQFVLHWTVN